MPNVEKVDLTNTMVGWNEPGSEPQIGLIPWPASHGEDRAYAATDGACWAGVRKASLPARMAYLVWMAGKIRSSYHLAPSVIWDALAPLEEAKKYTRLLRQTDPSAFTWP
jgi:hypothetical protein